MGARMRELNYAFSQLLPEGITDMDDAIRRWIRTVVPAFVGGGIFWLNNLLGIDIDSEGLTVPLAAAVIAIYHGAVTLAEKRWPVVGLLLGAKKAV